MRGAAAVLQAFLVIAGPLAFAAWFRGRSRLPWGLFGLGAVAFAGSQLVHLPLLWLGGRWLEGASPAVVAAALGLAAALCEEPARAAVFAARRRETKGVDAGVLVGLGHGGIEANILGLFVLLGFLGAAAVPESAPALVRERAALILEAPPLLRLLAAFERATAIACHVGCSVLVQRAVLGETLRKSTRVVLFLSAILAHALLDGLVVALAPSGGVVAAELIGLAFALAALAVVLFLRDVERRDAPAPAAPPRALEPGAAISCRGLAKSFDERAVVLDLDLDVAKGEVFALLGPNGSGKTTTVRLLAGLIDPSGGAARVAGHAVGDENDLLHARVGVLTEAPGLYERLSAFENLELHGRLHGLDAPRRRARIEALLGRFGLWDRRDDEVSGWSKGMKQKLAISRALLHEPDVLFLDEPTAGLDPQSTREVLDLCASLAGEGRTILLTTHRLEEAEELAARIGLFRGKLLRQGTLDELSAGVGERAVKVTVASKHDELLAAAAKLSFVRAPRRDGDALVVPVEDLDRDTPELVRALVEAGAAVRAVAPLRASLEDVDMFGARARRTLERIRAVVRREWLELRGNKVVLASFVFVPALLTTMAIGQLALAHAAPDKVPTAAELAKLPGAIAARATTQREALSLMMTLVAPALFVLVQTILPAIMATHSIVGEKLARSLEPLLATPIRTWELLLAKVIAAVVPAVVPALAGGVVYLVVASRLAVGAARTLVFSPEWILSIALVGPLVAVLAVSFAVLVSSRATDIQSAQSAVGFLTVPVIGLGILQLFEATLLSLPNVLAAAFVLATADVLALWLAASVFERETIISRWR